MFKTRTIWGVALAAILAWAPQAVAQQSNNGLSLDRFQPSMAGDRFFGVEGGDPGGHALPRLMLLGDYAYRPMTLYRSADDSRIGDVVGNQLILHLSGAVTLWDRLLIGADMPLALLTNGSDLTIDGGSFKAPSGASAGDLRVDLRLRLAGEAKSLASLSVGGHIYFPTGDKGKFTGSGDVHGSPVVILAGEDSSFAYAVNAGVDIQKQKAVAFANPLGTQLTFGGAIGLLLADRMLQIGPEVYGSTVMVGDNSFTKSSTNLEAILGARMRVSEFVFGAGAGPGFTRGVGTPAARVVASIAWVPEPPKPLPPPPPPPPPRPVKKPKPADRDHDGIIDTKDACPDEPGVPNDDPDKNGCPPDRDGDGIIDAKDACPDVKGVPSDDPEQNGCPPDSDGDGIRDDKDACPYEKGVRDDDPSKNGCPRSVRVTATEIVILEQVQFKTGSAVILPASDDLLRQVAAALTEHPEIKKIEIQGHTDNRGGKRYNQRLSERRAASVKKWLIEKGQVDAGRLSSQGYGLSQPIDDNTTAEGRQKNRRVQFRITEKVKKEEVQQ